MELVVNARRDVICEINRILDIALGINHNVVGPSVLGKVPRLRDKVLNVIGVNEPFENIGIDSETDLRTRIVSQFTSVSLDLTSGHFITSVFIRFDGAVVWRTQVMKLEVKFKVPPVGRYVDLFAQPCSLLQAVCAQSQKVVSLESLFKISVKKIILCGDGE